MSVKKNYKSEFEGESSEEDKSKIVKLVNEEEMKREYEDDKIIKNKAEKAANMKKLHSPVCMQPMKYFLDCGYNLLVYGVGSKRNLINNFVK